MITFGCKKRCEVSDVVNVWGEAREVAVSGDSASGANGDSAVVTVVAV